MTTAHTPTPVDNYPTPTTIPEALEDIDRLKTAYTNAENEITLLRKRLLSTEQFLHPILARLDEMIFPLEQEQRREKYISESDKTSLRNLQEIRFGVIVAQHCYSHRLPTPQANL